MSVSLYCTAASSLHFNINLLWKFQNMNVLDCRFPPRDKNKLNVVSRDIYSRKGGREECCLTK